MKMDWVLVYPVRIMFKGALSFLRENHLIRPVPIVFLILPEWGGGAVGCKELKKTE